MFYIIVISTILFYLFRYRADNALLDCIKNVSYRCEEYKTYSFMSVIFFILGLPLILVLYFLAKFIRYITDEHKD